MNITFTALDLKISEEDRQAMYSEVMSSNADSWHFNEFRGCYMLPVYNAGGQLGGQAKGKNTKCNTQLMSSKLENEIKLAVLKKAAQIKTQDRRKKAEETEFISEPKSE